MNRAKTVQGFRGFVERHSAQHAVCAHQGAGRKKVIAKRFYSEHPPRAEYVLTRKGKTLGPVLAALKDWGDRFG
ncbi:MAG: helix-turn-helix transcriptional regulator [Alphaproteobacteria bacterium]|nr:helix-turn-helix transcriptional regulator [Alphaproteobacteria bacterium]